MTCNTQIGYYESMSEKIPGTRGSHSGFDANNEMLREVYHAVFGRHPDYPGALSDIRELKRDRDAAKEVIEWVKRQKVALALAKGFAGFFGFTSLASILALIGFLSGLFSRGGQ